MTASSSTAPSTTSTSADATGPGDTSDSGSGDTGTMGSEPPIWIAAYNYAALEDELAGLGPFVVYGWATDPAFNGYDDQLALLAQIDAPDVTKIVMLSSWTTLQSVLDASGVDALLDAGVEGFGYNTEGMMTPPDQMQALGNDSPDTNPVAIFSTLAAQAGFWTVWGPIRVTADNVPDQAIAAMVEGGLRGVALQEQQFIEQSCVADRVTAVEATAARYRNIADDPAFEVHVQVMPSRCANGDSYAVTQCGLEPDAPPFSHCTEFALEIAPTIDAMAIWASAPPDVDELVPLGTALRSALGG